VLDNLPPGLGWALVGIGAIVFVLVVGRFRTQAHRLQERSRELEHLSTELIRVNKMKSEFLANVSHELRTPLNAIVGFVDLLREGVYGELTPKQAGPVQRIEASASHLRHLVDQILDLAKMAAGRLEVHSEPIDLRPFILDVASEVEPLVSEKSLYLSLALGSTLPRVRTDPTHLRQIVLNLLGNAVKYTPSGTISVRTKIVPASDSSVPATVKPGQDTSATAARPWVAILVSDTGIGIGRNDQARIFEEFEQINAGPRGDSMNRGTGLGLPISRRLARLLGGDVTVESELGKGSTFTVWLPGEAAQ
jgi:signal transduction histidine kinase